MNRSLLYVGLLFILVGATLTIVPTASFSTIAGDRPVDVSVADDSEAFVAVANTQTPVTQPGDGVAVAELVNNLDASMTVEYEASVTSGSVAVENPSRTVTIPQGGREPITVACSPPGGGAGTATLRIDVVEARGGSATITDATLETTVEYDCPGRPGGGPGQPGNPSGPPGGAVAYVDDDQDLEYDEGERTVSEGELAEFDNDSAHLVVAAGGGRINFRNSEVEMAAKSITVGDATLASNREITLEAEEGTLSLLDSTIDAKNGAIELSAGEITAADSTVSTNREISMSAESGALAFSDSHIDAKNGEIELSGRSIEMPRTTVSTNREISMSAGSGSLTLTDATIDAKNGAIELAGSRVDAARATISTNAAITATADSGTLRLTDATVDSKNGEIELGGGSIDAAGATISTNVGISLATESGDLQLGEATVESKNGEVTVESSGDLLASGAVFETNVEISLSASGDVLLDAARLTSSNGQATVALDVESATLSIDSAVLDDRDSTITYSPSEAAVTGTPSRGSVQAD
ncbi:AsmA family protein [Halobellus limi]|uniref:Uncharacterized protein n=1 Tax=Halobellus limi TaxID=699433 RepID=A0A1H5TUC0_9EURY|nr:hypothetical protein [Halobellus limi]SEF65587.1 hypothetical protein SAMN04488133_0363 [Halobellus limi]